MEKKLNMDPEPLPDNLEDLNNMEYRNITVKGHFLHDKEIYLGPRSLNSPNSEQKGGGGVFSSQSTTGYHVITPFKIEGREETILVNRGWIPRSKMNPNTRKTGQVEGVIEIEGIVRLNEMRPQFTPEHKSGLFLYRDLDKMCALTRADPYFIDMKYDPKLPADSPVGSQTRVTLRNEHLQYIITWYSLSGITAYLWWRQVVKRVPF
jgi:surfeit locus 1 family protein